MRDLSTSIKLERKVRNKCCLHRTLAKRTLRILCLNQDSLKSQLRIITSISSLPFLLSTTLHAALKLLEGGSSQVNSVKLEIIKKPQLLLKMKIKLFMYSTLRCRLTMLLRIRGWWAFKIHMLRLGINKMKLGCLWPLEGHFMRRTKPKQLEHLRYPIKCCSRDCKS